MAWFTPPLTRPGNHRCPRCGRRPWPWTRGFWWARWRCPGCQSLLKWDRSRHYVGIFIGFLVTVGMLTLGSLFPHRPVLSLTGLAGRLSVAILIILCGYWWMESVSLVDGPPGSPSPSQKPSGTM